MGWPDKLCLVRHAESEGNVLTIEERAKFECSAHGYGLTERGKKQAEITGKYLRDQFGAFDAYYVSYYARARETLKIMYPGVKVFEDSRLAEAQRGIYHTMTHSEIEAKYPEEIKRKEREGLYHYRPWGGENWADVELRIHSFLGTLARDFEGQKVLVVVHGHWLVMFQKLIEHFTVEEALNRYNSHIVSNCSVNMFNAAKVNGKSKLVAGITNFAPWEKELA